MQEQRIAVQKMQDYINEHIYESISLTDLSKISLYSPWYSYRLFKEYTDYTPADYIRRLKLSKSAFRLRDEECRIIDIALELGFQSVEGYQRAFSREFGCNPREYARHPVPIYLFTPYGVAYQKTGKEYKKMAEVKNVFIRVIHKPQRKVLMKRGITATDYFKYCEEVGCDIWGLLTSMKSISGEPVCMWLPPKYKKAGTSEYVQGVEVSKDYEGEIPEGFEVILLPEADYLMFQGEPFEEENYGEAIGTVQEAMQKFSIEQAGYEPDTDNPRIQLEPRGTRGYIEMIPVKEMTK